MIAVGKAMTSAQAGLATIVEFRARVEGVSPAEAAELIAAHYRDGGWQQWAACHRLTVDEARQVVESLAAEAGGPGA